MSVATPQFVRERRQQGNGVNKGMASTRARRQREHGINAGTASTRERRQRGNGGNAGTASTRERRQRERRGPSAPVSKSDFPWINVEEKKNKNCIPPFPVSPPDL